MKRKLKTLFEQFGYYFYKPAKINGKTEFEIGDYSYGTNIPHATYSPWKNDKEFIAVHSKIDTLVDVYRCYEIWKLVDEVTKLSPKLNFIEIGVWRGGTGALISKKMEMNKVQGTLYLADTFTGVVKTGDNDSSYFGGEHKDTSEKLVRESLDSFKLNNYKILKGIFPDETAHLIPDDTPFGLCHIDVDVYLSAKDCLSWVWDRLIIGGVVVFDDYGFHTCDGITKLVEEQRQLTDRLVIHNLNGHGILIKIK